MPGSAKVYDMDEIFSKSGNQALLKSSVSARATKIEEVVSVTKPGDVLLLSRVHPLGKVDFSRVADGVTIQYGFDGEIKINSSRSFSNLKFAFNQVPVRAEQQPLSKGGSGKPLFKNTELFFTGGLNGVHEENTREVGKWYGVGSAKWVKTNETFRNCRVLYLNYNVNPGDGTSPKVNWADVDATGSAVYGTVETNYKQVKSAALFKRVRGLTWGNGDTESHRAPEGIYQMDSCSNMTLVNHRNFKTQHPDAAYGNGYAWTNGENNTMYGTEDIGASELFSLKALNEKQFSVFGMFNEADELIGAAPGMQKMAYTNKGFGRNKGEPITWVDPARINNEVVIDAGGLKIDHTTAVGASPNFSTANLRRPPRIPLLDMANFDAAKVFTNFKKVSAGWGKSVISAGADLTGKKSSAAILQKLASSQAIVELPEGILLVDKPVIFPSRPGRISGVIGAGKEKTIIRTTGNFNAFDFESPVRALTKSNYEPPTETKWVHDLTLDGQNEADFGIHKPNCVWQSSHIHNVKFMNFKIAGASVGTPGIDLRKTGSTPVPQLQGYCEHDGFDQVRFTFCEFINTGDFGIFSNNGQVDKGLYFKNVFKNQKVAGICYLHTHMLEATSFAENTFENISGPGVWLGGNGRSGAPPTTTGPVMLMENNFIECGSLEKDLAPIEWGYTKMGIVAGNRMTQNSKPVNYLFKGTGTIIQGFDFSKVNWSMVKKGSLAIRHPRRVHNNRMPGNFIVNVKSAAPLHFIEDLAEVEKQLNQNLKGRAQEMSYPHAYTTFLDSCEFGGQKLNYVMATQSPDGKSVAAKELQTNQSIQLSSIPAPIPNGGVSSPLISEGEGWVYDYQGKKLFELKGLKIGRVRNELIRRGYSAGIYFHGKPGSSLKKVSVQ